jgi:hypothetical protein
MAEKSAYSTPSGPNPSEPVLHLFEYSQPESFPERFPRLTCLAIACGLITASLIAEIDYLHSSGYFWR